MASASVASSMSRSTPACSPETTIWVGELRLASATVPASGRLLAQRAEPAGVEADDRGHRAGALVLDGRHAAAALGHQAHAVLGGDRAGGHGGGVLAEAVAGDEVGPQAGLARQGVDGERQGEDRGLGDIRARQLLLRPVAVEVAQRQAGHLAGAVDVAFEQVAAGLQQLRAHADALRALTGEQEGGLRHSAGAPSIG